MLFYVFFAWLYIARGASLSGSVWGRGYDPFIFIWSLAWWPWAVAGHLSLLHTDLMWQPQGVLTFWVTGVPALAALAAPVTLSAGPVAAYNLLVVAAPVGAAMMAFWLCRRLARGFWPALAGGYLFGFSSYQMAIPSALNLVFSVLVPGVALVVVARWQRRISLLWAVGLLAAAAVAQFLISTEVLVLLALVGAACWGVGLVVAADWRGRLVALGWEAAAAGVVAGLVLAAPLVSILSYPGFLHLPSLWPRFHVADVLGSVIPGVHAAIGGGWSRAHIFGAFSDVREDYSYLGLPLVVVVYGLVRRRWAEVGIRFLGLAVVVVTVASWGPGLWVAGWYTGVPGPWAVVMGLPFVGDVLPARLALFVALGVAVLGCLWLDERLSVWRVALMVLACVVIVPDAPARQAVPESAFFAPGRVEAVLGARPRILVLPFAVNGPCDYWQMENRFGFTMTGGYLGFPPAAAQIYPAVQELYGGRPQDVLAGDLADFARRSGTQYVVAGPGTPGALIVKLEGLGWPERRVDDVTVFTVPAAKAS